MEHMHGIDICLTVIVCEYHFYTILKKYLLHSIIVNGQAFASMFAIGFIV